MTPLYGIGVIWLSKMANVSDTFELLNLQPLAAKPQARMSAPLTTQIAHSSQSPRRSLDAAGY